MRNPEKDQDFGKIPTPGRCDGNSKRRMSKCALIFEKKEKFTWLKGLPGGSSTQGGFGRRRRTIVIARAVCL